MATFTFFSQAPREAVLARTASPRSLGRKNANFIHLRKSYTLSVCAINSLIHSLYTNYEQFRLFPTIAHVRYNCGQDTLWKSGGNLLPI